MAFLTYIKKLDWSLMICVFLLAGFGLLELYSISSAKHDFLNFGKQVFFLIIGFSLIFALSFFNWRLLRDNSYLLLFFYGICILLLAGLFLVSSTRGIKGWYKFDYFSFDPVEPVKLILIIILAKYFSMRHIEMYRLRHIIFSGFYALLPAVLIFFQPNLGSALILIILWFGILIISGIKRRHFMILIFCGLFVLSISWLFLLKDYQKDRIISFFMPQQDPLGVNWSQKQSEIAIGSGGMWGQGFLRGSQARYGFLPESHTDFIFAAISEEFGFAGGIIIFILFLFLIWRIIKIAISSISNFPRFFASGIALIILSQFFINIGMNLGVLPVIGISLPFVSYGGSGFITLCIGLGILQSVKTN